MGKEYIKVLQALNVDFEVVGRGKENCNTLRKTFPSIKVIEGGIEAFDHGGEFTHAIIASSIHSLFENSICVLKSGIKQILLEKPGATNSLSIRQLAQLSQDHKATILLAYNRRFYSSIRKAKEMIEEDGGVLSFLFEFTEWAHTIEPLLLPDDVKQNWFLANSSHVVDTAFYLAGAPQELKAFGKDSLEWHKSAAIFSGSGISEKGALFSYHANWKAPGRWGLELLTANHRLILRPMEILQIMRPKSVAIEEVEIDDRLDKEFKPGLFLQTKNFLNQQHNNFCTIHEQSKLATTFYNKISLEA